MKIKCLICGKKDKTPSIKAREWINTGVTEAKFGRDLEIHSKCISGTLMVEIPGKFIYSSIKVHSSFNGKSKKKKKLLDV